MAAPAACFLHKSCFPAPIPLQFQGRLLFGRAYRLTAPRLLKSSTAFVVGLTTAWGYYGSRFGFGSPIPSSPEEGCLRTILRRHPCASTSLWAFWASSSPFCRPPRCSFVAPGLPASRPRPCHLHFHAPSPPLRLLPPDAPLSRRRTDTSLRPRPPAISTSNPFVYLDCTSAFSHSSSLPFV
ncbi:hypothetical protein B0H16DRAFT_1551175 [Mycena metata]|uniref:Uncharacterized protein n=1 Tax=Mycena metata TaxID=1033252 RepID=A0AAD7IVV9_9AGAR|nr:hypothetical protein B0H16DRAFT_1551175 [Mycena metata]